jgi:hypothetical protein
MNPQDLSSVSRFFRHISLPIYIVTHLKVAQAKSLLLLLFFPICLSSPLLNPEFVIFCLCPWYVPCCVQYASSLFLSDAAISFRLTSVLGKEQNSLSLLFIRRI